MNISTTDKFLFNIVCFFYGCNQDKFNWMHCYTPVVTLIMDQSSLCFMDALKLQRNTAQQASFCQVHHMCD